MKKFWAFLLVFVLAFSLVACGEDETSKKTDDEEEAESTTESVSTDESASADESTGETPDESAGETSGETSDETSGEGNIQDVLTPEEIFATLDGSDGGKLSVTMTIPEVMTMTMSGESTANGSHIVTTMEMMGMSETSEEYTEWVGDVAYAYYQDEEGNWYKEQVEMEENTTNFEAFASLFVSDAYEAYDASTGRYIMKEGFTAEMDGFTVSNGYLEAKDGAYTVYGELSMSMEGVTITGTLSFTISDLGNVSITFPQVTE